MNISNLMPFILAIIIGMLILSIIAASMVAVFEEKQKRDRKYYIYPVFRRKDFESYPAPYCPHCAKRLYNKQKFCQECGAGFIWPQLEVQDIKVTLGLDDRCSAAYKKIFDDFNKKGTY